MSRRLADGYSGGAAAQKNGSYCGEDEELSPYGVCKKVSSE
jgi:hypothetical protein